MVIKLKVECMTIIMIFLLCFTNAALIYTNKLPEVLYADINDIIIEVEEENQIGIALEEPIDINEITQKYELFKEKELNIELFSYDIPNNSGFKTYMSYGLFTSGSPQYQVQELAITNQDGIREVDGRYCVAIGTHFKAKIGQYIDLILENDTVIPCVIGDKKAPQHTDPSNIFSLGSGCASEFIVDTATIRQEVKQRGNMSFNKPEWDSPVVKIKVYENNVLEDL